MKKITIAIDGYSSTGKSTLAKQIAKHFGYVFVDTGAMYRAVTLFAMQNQIITKEFFHKEALIEQLNDIYLKFEFNEGLGYAEMFMNGVNVESRIRTIEVSNFVSQIAAVAEVRKKLVEQQQKFGIDKGVVMDGRDIGTVVFPNAELKLFMTASPEIRAKRRFDELQAKGDSVSYEEVFKNVVDRDTIDSNREASPLVKAIDAIIIDNSDLTREKQFDNVVQLVENKLNF